LNKAEIRSLALQNRDALSAEARQSASLAICRSIMDEDLFLDAGGIHVYLPIGSEVDIRPLIDVAWELGKKVGMMRVMDDGGICQYTITPETEYQTATKMKMKILEPIDAEMFEMNDCDLVIVPVVAIDEECNRLGYGRGYYDQFLSHYPRPTIGVAFEAQVVPRLPVDEGDIQLDMAYTEERMIGEGMGRPLQTF
jgi:5-formyltetrahydrofolate cyclo-ligase